MHAEDELKSCKGGLLWKAKSTHEEIKEKCNYCKGGDCTMPFIGPFPGIECVIYDKVVGLTLAVGEEPLCIPTT